MRSDTGRLHFGPRRACALTLIAAGRGERQQRAAAHHRERRTAAAVVSTTRRRKRRAATGSEEVRLAVNPWTGSRVNANIAKAVIEKPRHRQGRLVEIDENAHVAAPIAKGRHARRRARDLAVRPRRGPCRPTSPCKKGIVDGGLLGPDAKIGWYVPQFVVDEHPELADMGGFQGPELAAAVQDGRVRRSRVSS